MTYHISIEGSPLCRGPLEDMEHGKLACEWENLDDAIHKAARLRRKYDGRAKVVVVNGACPCHKSTN